MGHITDLKFFSEKGQKIDSAVNTEDTLLHPIEYINSLEDAGIPPHNLILKKGAIVMCLRNLNINGGLANGTRLVVEEIINGG